MRLIAAPVPTGTVDFMTSACRSEAGIASTTAWTADRSASPDPAQGAGDGQHLRVLEGLQEGVGDPVHRPGRAPRDQPQAAAVEEQLVGAAGHAPVLRRVVEDGWGLPGGPLDAVVLADLAGE